MKYIFFGSSNFSKLLLENLIKDGFEKPCLVVTQPAKPKGRHKILSPTPVQMLAEFYSLPFLTPDNLEEKSFLQKIKKFKPDFALLSGYGKIIPSSLLKIVNKGFLNLHPSLLEKYRGATPIQAAILNGDKKTGVTLFLMDEKLDHGPIIAQKEIILEDNLNYSQLEEILAQLGKELIKEAIPLYLEGKIELKPQDEEKATYCHKISSQEEKLDFNKSCFLVDRKVRAFNPFPGVYAEVNTKGTKNEILRIKIIEGYPLKTNEPEIQKKKNGEIIKWNQEMAVKCQDGIYILKTVRPAAKRDMSGKDFLAGHPWLIGKIFE